MRWTRIKVWIGIRLLWRRMKHEWDIALKLATHADDSARYPRSLIVPCDPWHVVGSRGDQAMVIAIIQNVQKVHPESTIDIITIDHTNDEECRSLGLNPVACWNEPMDKWFEKYGCHYSDAYILGADVTDGVYGWVPACKLLMYYDVLSACGADVHYLGFSWSTTPSPMMRRVMRKLTRGLPLPVRDPVSFERVAAFTNHRPLVQVADAAFCLKPRESGRVERHRAWVDAQRSAGKRVVAVNVHTMFNEEETRSADWERVFIEVLNAVQKSRSNIKWLLLPHDNRPRVSDHAILKRMYLSMNSAEPYLVDEVMNADEIKALIGACDGLIAGRMHISIGALGMGVPVFGLVYQGKFEGLWQHFGLADDTLISPREFLVRPDVAVRAVCNFIDRLPALRQKISTALPIVLQMAERNFQ